ncbi:MAG: F0F1 ATP synthase subunit epsilon [Alphaproteobacteria bacterium]|nr:F0F1 ATP synthase subunit epsilon [Alphaproteobacteria bacterium]
MAERLTDKNFQFDLVSPEKLLFSGEVNMAVIPGVAGDFGVLADHAPLLSSIRPGVVRLTMPDGEEQKVFIAGGFADVSDNVCAVLAEEAVDVATLDVDALRQQVTEMKDDLSFAKDDPAKVAHIEEAIALAEAKIAAAA